MINICVDSSFLIALYDEGDEHHLDAECIFLKYFDNSSNQLFVPWPILYESVSSRMVKHKNKIDKLWRDWQILRGQGRLYLQDDLPFREKAITECFEETRKPFIQYRALSLVDRVIRNILSETSFKIDLFVTFDVKDFIDICARFNRNMEL